jgi:hypothetical protein
MWHGVGTRTPIDRLAVVAVQHALAGWSHGS